MYNDFTLPNHFVQDDNDRFLQSLQDYAPTEDIQPYVEEMPNKTEAFLAKDGIKLRMAVKTDFPPLQTVQPLPLRNAPQEQATYPVEALGKFAEVTNLLSESVQVDVSMVGNSILSALSVITQHIANVHTKDGRTIPLSLFCLSIADSGDRKSSLDKIVLGAVNATEKDLYKRYLAELREYE